MKILVVVTRRIGDVLLTTPLIRSLRQAHPDAELDVLVFAGTEGVLAANADISRVISIPARQSLAKQLKFLASLWRQYDLALSTMTGDRPSLYAMVAGRRSIGLVEPGANQQWKHKLLSQTVPFDNLNTHTVLMNLQLAQALSIQPCYQVVLAWSEADERSLADKFVMADSPYVVLHTHPMYVYKAWQQQGWLELAQWLQQQGLRIVLSGGNSEAEREFAGQLMRSLAGNSHGVVNLVGQVKLSEVACLLQAAKAYVGPDTVVTHMAAAAGIPTVALFGPSNPVKWGPWPAAYRGPANPYQLRGNQRQHNVMLLQGAGDCVPCFEEGCDRHLNSLSKCLQQLPAAQVIHALQQLWAD